MNALFKRASLILWKKYFGGAETSHIFYYTNEQGHAELIKLGMEASFLSANSWKKVHVWSPTKKKTEV